MRRRVEEWGACQMPLSPPNMIVAPAEILLCTIVFIYLLNIVLLFMFTFKIDFYNKVTHKESPLLSG